MYLYTFRDILLHVKCCHFPSSHPHSSPQFESCLGVSVCTSVHTTKQIHLIWHLQTAFTVLAAFTQKPQSTSICPSRGSNGSITEINSHKTPNTHKRKSKDFFFFPDTLQVFLSVENSRQLSFCVLPKHIRRKSNRTPLTGELKHSGELLLTGFLPHWVWWCYGHKQAWAIRIRRRTSCKSLYAAKFSPVEKYREGALIINT